MAALPALFGLLMAALVSGEQRVEIYPQRAVERAGGELTVLCKVPYPIDSCRMTVGGVPYRLRPDDLVGEVVYAGKGLGQGECGARIRNIKEEWNGPVTCTLPPPSGAIELTGTMRLVVARAPSPPVLYAPEQSIFKEGDHYMAQCVSANGRPAANITWFLDDELITEGIHQPVLESEPGSDLETVKQNLSRTLTAEDEGRRLSCQAAHVALQTPGQAARQLTVHYPPRRADGESGIITIFGLSLGVEGRLNVTVRAAPPPQAEWTIAGQALGPSQQTNDGLITAMHPLPLGAGYYNVTLILSRVSKEDVDRTYYLRLTNNLGHAELSVRISTMDEPAGVELDTGAIVGIVVAVLVLLVAVFLAVFAKATDRWCFAGGRNRDHTKSSGESDTESAVGGRAGRGERSRLGALSARVRAVLPRAKDKVQATEQAPEADEKLSEEKKGVVYAELALGEQPAGDKPAPAPPSAEYAEIVYTEQQKERE